TAYTDRHSFTTRRSSDLEPALHFAVDRNTVVVVKRNQFAELEGAGERTRFVRDTLHQAAIAEKCVAVMVDDSVAVTVELRGENLDRKSTRLNSSHVKSS